MKRRRIVGPVVRYSNVQNDLDQSIQIQARKSDESTLLIEVGGGKASDMNDINVSNAAGVGISASMRGTDCMVYDNFFWAKDFYTFTQRNCTIGLIVLGWNKAQQRLKQVIVPLCIPNVLLSFGSIDKPDNTPANLLALQKQLAYALELLFAAHDDTAYTHRFFKTWTISPKVWDTLAVNDTYCPIFQDTLNAPPLEWVVTGDGHLALVNRFDPFYTGNYRFAFNLITLQPEWFNEKNYYYRTLVGTTSFFTIGTSGSPAINSDSMLGNRNGWMGSGPNVFGFGKPLLNAATVYSNSGILYVDDFVNPVYPQFADQKDTFINTNWAKEAPGNLPFCNTDDYFNNWILGQGLHERCIFAPRFCSLCPSRFYTVESEALTRNQRRPIASNNNLLGKAGVCGIIFPPPIVNTGSDLTSSVDPGGLYQEYSQNPGSVSPDQPVLHTRANENRDIIDLEILDEFARPVSNPLLAPTIDQYYVIPIFNYNPGTGPYAYSGIDPAYWYVNMHSNDSSWFYGLWTAGQAVPIPFLPFNPDATLNPNGECMLGPYQAIDQSILWGEERWRGSSDKKYRVPADRNISTFPGTSLVHFVRLINNSS